MAQIQIWGGGPYHPTKAQSVWMKDAFATLGHSTSYREDRGAFDEKTLAATDLLILSGMDESKVCPEAALEYWETRPAQRFTYQPLADAHYQALKGYLAQGKPLFIHHSGILSFDERTELTEIYDGRWVRDQTFHPPYQKFKVRALGSHPVLAGIQDFQIEDEMYCKLRNPTRSQVLLESQWEGVKQPLAWATTYGPSKILFSGLGHDMGSYACPELQRFIKNGVQWLLTNG